MRNKYQSQARKSMRKFEVEEMYVNFSRFNWRKGLSSHSKDAPARTNV